MKPFVTDMHTHSIMSGHAFGTVREMAAEAAGRGIRLLGITEHGPGIPGTVSPIYFLNLIDAPRKLYGVEILYGSEVNVLDGGRLDLEERYLERLDYAIAGVHGLCYEDGGIVKNTDDLIRCMAHPKVRFVSHPDNNNFALDYQALVQGAREYDVALEVNNSSLRKPRLRPGCVENYQKMVPLCMECGVPIIVNTDAHDPGAVGDFTLARKLLDQMELNEELILSSDVEKMKAFLLK